MLKPLPASRWNYSSAAHLLNRAGFGGPPGEIQRLVKLGLEGAVDWLVGYDQVPAAMPNPDWAKPDATRAERFRAFRAASEEQRREMRREQQRIQRQRIFELRSWWLNRMVKASRPLEEKLTLFWHGHFATSFEKVKDAYLIWLQNDTFRQHAAGRWFDLLQAVARDPAMLLWLDQAESKKDHPNENFARELMELFTLGEGNYTEKDVVEAARALTGWSINRIAQEYQYRPFFHDPYQKSFLGQTGNLTGDHILEAIVSRPQAARFITGKLWRFFVSENLAPELNEGLAKTFQKNQQQFRPLLRLIFSSEEFYHPSVIRSQIKSPVQWLIGSVRLLERDLPPPVISTNALRTLGQDLFAPPNVKGWDGGLSWITTNTLLSRYNFSAALVLGQEIMADGPARSKMKRAQRRRPRTADDPGPVEASRLVSADERRDKASLLRSLQNRLLQGTLHAKNLQPIQHYLQEQSEITDRVILQTVRMMISTPEFQLT